MNPIKILIADDEPDVLSILEKKLRQNGYEVLALSKGSQILEQAKSFAPDLLILDIGMPDADGYSVAQELRRHKGSASTPILFMTGQDLDFTAVSRHVEQVGKCDFIQKPCTFEELLAKVKEIL